MGISVGEHGNLFEYIDGKGLGILKPQVYRKTTIDNTGKSTVWKHITVVIV